MLNLQKQPVQTEMGGTPTQTAPTKKEQIIDKAIEIFSRNGIAHTKIEDITKAVGIAKGTLYLYFKSKRQLLLSCMDRLATIVVPQDVWEDIRRETDFGRRFTKRQVAFLKAYPTVCGLLSLVYQSLESHDPVLAKKAAATYQLLTGPVMKDIRWATGRGMAKKVDEEVIAYILVGAGEALGNMLRVDSRYTPEMASDICLDFMLNGIGAEKCKSRSVTETFYWDIRDRNNHTIQLHEVRCNENDYLTGKMGRGEIQIPLHNIASLSISKERDTDSCLCRVVLKNGESTVLAVEGDTLVSGQTDFGRYIIRLKEMAGSSIPLTDTSSLNMA